MDTRIDHHFVAAASLLAACSSPFATPPETQGSGRAPGAPTVSPATHAQQRPLLVKVVMRNAELAVVSGPEGPRFSVEGQDGVLCSDLGEAELEMQYPAIYDLYRSAVVRTGTPYLDATLGRSIDEQSSGRSAPQRRIGLDQSDNRYNRLGDVSKMSR